MIDHATVLTTMRTAVRFLAYPLVFGGLAAVLVTLAAEGVAYWPMFPLIGAVGLMIVALLERYSPYEPAWNWDIDGDTRADLCHFLVSHGLIQGAIAAFFGMRVYQTEWPAFWPSAAPMWLQVLLAGAVMDLGLYIMHRASHSNPLLWRLHTIHHSPRRLYWLNGGRRHPLSALALATPGLVVLAVLGVTPIALGAWMSIMSIHLAWQHANLDYSLGPFRHFLGVAEMHRWHHKRDFEDAQVNFGEVWLIWDIIFGTYYDAARRPARGDVGLSSYNLPPTYTGQLLWPFKPDTR